MPDIFGVYAALEGGALAGQRLLLRAVQTAANGAAAHGLHATSIGGLVHHQLQEKCHSVFDERLGSNSTAFGLDLAPKTTS